MATSLASNRCHNILDGVHLNAFIIFIVKISSGKMTGRTRRMTHVGPIKTFFAFFVSFRSFILRLP